MNRNYVSGRRREYQIKRQLEADGFVCTRSSRSKGIWDITAVNVAENVIYLVQVKPKRMGEAAKRRLEDKHSELDMADVLVRFKVM